MDCIEGALQRRPTQFKPWKSIGQIATDADGPPDSRLITNTIDALGEGKNTYGFHQAQETMTIEIADTGSGAYRSATKYSTVFSARDKAKATDSDWQSAWPAESLGGGISAKARVAKVVVFACGCRR